MNPQSQRTKKPVHVRLIRAKPVVHVKHVKLNRDGRTGKNILTQSLQVTPKQKTKQAKPGTAHHGTQAPPGQAPWRHGSKNKHNNTTQVVSGQGMSSCTVRTLELNQLQGVHVYLHKQIELSCTAARLKLICYLGARQYCFSKQEPQ